MFMITYVLPKSESGVIASITGILSTEDLLIMVRSITKNGMMSKNKHLFVSLFKKPPDTTIKFSKIVQSS